MGTDTPLKFAVYSAQPHDRDTISEAVKKFNDNRQSGQPEIEATYQSLPLTVETTSAAAGCAAVCVFVQDEVSRDVLTKLSDEHGIKCVLLRCAGFNNVDMDAAKELGFRIARVPAYSPESIAEFTLALILTLNRKIHRAYNRVRENNFSLTGLVGFTVHGSTVGIIGTGKIGLCSARILRGLGCRILAYDPATQSEVITKELQGEYVDLETLLSQSDIVTLHCPLIEKSEKGPGNRHIINSETLGRMKKGAMLINTSRGALLDTKAVIQALKSQQLGSLGLDVYEDEGPLFFRDLSQGVMQDDIFARLTSFPNVVVCGHQAFFTRESLMEIAQATVENLVWFDGVKDGQETPEGFNKANILV